MAPPTRLQWLRPYTTRFFNPLSRRFVAWLPGFGVLMYRGRKSGREYRTPMNVFRQGDEVVFALTYGPDVQWVKNILAAGEARVRSLGRTTRLVEPVLFVDPERRSMPFPVRQILGVLRVSHFMRMRVARDG